MKHYKTLIDHKKETYDWSTYVPKGAEKLILGTFPTALANRDFQFFYPNIQNRMWKILAGVAKHELNEELKGEAAVNERKKVLDKLNLAMGDMGKAIYRLSNSSLDLNIFPVEYTNIFKTLYDHPLITKIILTSSSKGNSVLNWFIHYCSINGYVIKIPKKFDKPYLTHLELPQKKIAIIILYSVSGAAGKKTEDLIRMYSEAMK